MSQIWSQWANIFYDYWASIVISFLIILACHFKITHILLKISNFVIAPQKNEIKQLQWSIQTLIEPVHFSAILHSREIFMMKTAVGVCSKFHSFILLNQSNFKYLEDRIHWITQHWAFSFKTLIHDQHNTVIPWKQEIVSSHETQNSRQSQMYRWDQSTSSDSVRISTLLIGKSSTRNSIWTSLIAVYQDFSPSSSITRTLSTRRIECVIGFSNWIRSLTSSSLSSQTTARVCAVLEFQLKWKQLFTTSSFHLEKMKKLRKSCECRRNLF